MLTCVDKQQKMALWLFTEILTSSFVKGTVAYLKINLHGLET